MTAPSPAPEFLAGIDLLDLDRWARHGAPHHWFARLRETAPVWRHPSPTPDGRPGFWVVSGYDDVVALGRCPHILSSDDDNGGVSGLGPGDELEEETRRTGEELGPGRAAMGDDAKFLLTLDPPEHTAYRKIVSRGFTPRMITQLEPRVRQQVRLLLAATPQDEVFDLVEALSMPLPMRVIGDLIGVPPEDHDRILRWSNQSLAGTDAEYRRPDGSILAAVGAMLDYFGGLRDGRSREQEDRPDLVSVLMDASVDGHSLSDLRFRMFLFLLAVAGSETTRSAISHGVLALHEHPGQWQRLRRDPSLIPAAVEEILRWASPVLYFRRNALTEMDIGGQLIEPGDLVSLWYVSANRDPARFSSPEVFDISREPNPHVAFGGGGPHFCLGASLARLELRVVLEELLTSHRHLEVTGPVQRLRSNFLHGIKHLPVRTHPAESESMGR
jgi:cholest-4-en-3-one 26-monooxygenase